MATAPAALVLDASAALQAVMPDSHAHGARAQQLLGAILAGDIVAHVPMIFFNELASACARAVRGRRLSREDAEEFFQMVGLARLELAIEVSPPGVLFDRALAWGCQVADGVYLQLALARSLPLATTDKGLIAAARGQGAAIFGVTV